jgi:hypothetical protein
MSRTQLKPLTDKQITRRLVDAQRNRIAALERKLASLDWRRITPENLPKVGDEVLFASGTVKHVTEYDAKQWIHYWNNCTHRRHINPPSEHPAPEKGEATK